MSDPATDRLLNHNLTGRQLGDYNLLRRLGRGGMADVYLATQGSLNRKVALKILKPDLAKDHSYVQRFHREAQAAAALVQSNIVQIYEVGEADGYHFIAQEYVQGRNLKQYLTRNGAVEPVMAVNILSQCSKALQKAGELHVIHRDIKPENIMLSSKGEVKITDFGLARLNNESAEQALTQVGITMGTPLYMSPEQVEGGVLDTRSDIYSLGVTAYHMLAGQPPFDGDSPLAIAVQQVKDKAIPLHTLRRDAPEELCQIIHAMMNKRPEDRPADAKQLLKELLSVNVDFDTDWEKILERLAIAEPTPGDSDPQSSSSPTSHLEATRQLQDAMKGNIGRTRRVPGWLKAVAVALVAGVAGLSAAAITSPPDPLGRQEEAANTVPRQATVEEQVNKAYWDTYALRRDKDLAEKEQFWRAVVDYFPLEAADESNRKTTELMHCRAMTRLGELYLSEDKYDEAQEVFDWLAERNERLSKHYRLMGVAGQAVIFDKTPLDEFAGGIEERDNQVRRCLAKIGGQYELLNVSMREKVENLFSRYPPHS